MKSPTRLQIEFIEPFGYGAMVHVAHQLANALADRGHDVTVVGAIQNEVAHLTTAYTRKDDFDLPRDDLVLASRPGWWNYMHRIVHRCLLAARFTWQYFIAIRGVARRHPDYVVVSTVFRYPFIGLLLRYLTRHDVRLVQICHEFELREQDPSLWYRFAIQSNRRLYDLFSVIVFLSRYQHARFCSLHTAFIERSTHIPLANGAIFADFNDPTVGADFRRESGISDDEDYILFFGRVQPDKGVDDLIAAYALLVATRPSAPTLVIAGRARATYLRALEHASSTGCGGRIVIIPTYVPSEAVWHILGGAVAVVFPYRSASQSAALQVAMSRGCPIIATSAGGISEVLTDGVTGLVVDPGDVEALAAELSRLLDDPTLRHSLGMAAARSAQDVFSWVGFALNFENALVGRQESTIEGRR